MEPKKLKTIKTIRVKTDAEKPIEIEILAESIKAVSDHFNKAINSGLRKRAIAILIHDIIPSKNKVGIVDILTILDNLPLIKLHLTK